VKDGGSGFVPCAAGYLSLDWDRPGLKQRSDGRMGDIHRLHSREGPTCASVEWRGAGVDLEGGAIGLPDPGGIIWREERKLGT